MIYDVAIERLPISALFDLKGKQGYFSTVLATMGLTFPDRANAATRSGDVELCWIGPDHWLLRAPLDREQDLLQGLESAVQVTSASVVLISDTLATFEISGPDANQILAIASPLDTHPRAFPENGVSYTEAFGLKALVVRRENGFELAVDRSFGVMVADYLARAVGGSCQGTKL